MKTPFFYSIFLAAALFSSCEKAENKNTALLSESKNFKPRVAIIPLIDNSDHSLEWSLSDEFTNTLCAKLDQRDVFLLDSPGKVKMLTKKIKGINNPFGQELQWTKQVFTEEDFVVFLELIEHREVLNEGKLKLTTAVENLSAQLNICLRLRILDLRGEEPKITLQEILQDSHFIPKQFTQQNFPQTSWNTEEFNLSPMGIAHAQLIKELRSRIEDYILLAKD